MRKAKYTHNLLLSSHSAALYLAPPFSEISRRNNPLRQRAQAKLKAAAGETWLPRPSCNLSLSSPISCARSFSAADAGASGQPAPAAAPRRPIQMPDEYLPPNQVLFLQNLPEGTTKEDLQEVFEQSVIIRVLRS
jgi:U2 small nuclear ribonucleoprotein B''